MASELSNIKDEELLREMVSGDGEIIDHLKTVNL